jgi:hypothetical protein
MFVTEGNRLGIGPQSLHENDQVWVLSGANVPFILRRPSESSANFRIIGEAFVLGVMHGEAVNDNDNFEPIEIE